ncbi:MAG TPA: VanW family protein, partial [Candidatus Binatia bacterium]|nr:VanW family protein [Candidatus Binatia bacterium]
MTSATLANPRTLFLPGPPRRGLLVGFFGTLSLGLFLVLGVSIGLGASHSNRILPGVQVAGVSVGGLDRSAAAARLQAELPSLAAGAITVVVDGTPVEVPYADIGRGYQFEAMLDAAFGIARSGNPLADGVTRLRTLAHDTSLPLSAQVEDEAAINGAVTDLVNRFSVAPVNAQVAYDPTAGFEVTPAVDGARVDRAALRQSLAAAASRSDFEPVTISVATIAVPPSVSTADARTASSAATWMTGTPLPLRAGDDTFAISSADLAGLLTFERDTDGSFTPVVDETALAALLETHAASVERAPKDAGFTWGSSGVSGVVPGVEGRALDVEGSVASVVNALQDRAAGSLRPVASLAVVTTQPALSTDAAEAAASKMRRIGTWTTYYVPGEANYWNKNIHIPAWDIDKLVIAPGEWFDFWDDIGPISTARGYGYGGAIIGGRSVPTGALAGGICSTSTTLFNAAMRAGLEIGDRTNHYYYISRYPTGLDATVFQTDTYEVNMTFRNDTAAPVVIRSYTGNGWVRFDVWGVPDGRTVALSAPSTSNHRSASETTVVNTSLAPGTSRRVEYPH